jgi:hypothetical protein
LLILGYLHCIHPDTDSAENALWGILNPAMTDDLPKYRLIEVL